MKERFNHYKEFLSNLLPFAEIEHVGGSSIPGALTKNDLDIQIRVPSEKVEEAKNILSEHLVKRGEELWNQDFAIFLDANIDIQVDIMVTANNSSYDTFSKVRDLLIANNDGLLDQYNEIKKNFFDYHSDEYRAAKKEFFGKIRNEYLDIES